MTVEFVPQSHSVAEEAGNAQPGPRALLPRCGILGRRAPRESDLEAHLNIKERWLYLIAFPAGHAAVDWGGGAFWLLTPAMASALDLSPAQVGLLFAMRQAGSGIAQLPAGLIGDSLRKRGPFLLATFWWVAVAQLGASTSPGYWLIGVLLAVASAGAAAWHPVAQGVMVQRMPDRRAFALAVHLVGGMVAEVFAPLAVGFLLVYLDWRQVLQISTLPAIIMGLLFLRFSRLVAPSGQGAISLAEVRGLGRSVLRGPAIAMLSVLSLQNMSIIALMSMTPLYLEQERGFSSGLAGVAFAVLVVSGAVLGPIVGSMSDRAGRKPLMIGGLVLGGVSAWLLTVLPGVTGVFLSLGLAGLFMLTVRPVILATALEVVGRREATVLGVISTIGEGIAAAGAAIAGFLGNVDLAYALVFSGMLSMAGGAIVALLPLRSMSAAHGAPARERRGDEG